jgi:hypothetical protein
MSENCDPSPRSTNKKHQYENKNEYLMRVIMQELDFISSNKDDFLKYLKLKFTMIHQSNFFYRDFHYGLLSFLHEHGRHIDKLRANNVAHAFLSELERTGIAKKIDHQTWMLNYPEFALPRVEKKSA